MPPSTSEVRASRIMKPLWRLIKGCLIWWTNRVEPGVAAGPGMKEGAAATATFSKIRDPEEVWRQQLSGSSVRGRSWRRKYSTGS